MFKDFKTFIAQGNVMDLAVGVIIGAAFGKIVDSIVNDLIMPVVGIAFQADFNNLYVPLFRSNKLVAGMPLAEVKKLGPVFAWGSFVTVVINFLILAFIVFMLVRLVNRVVQKKAAEPAPPSNQEILLGEIRDLLKHKP